jgi:hypothetical protein
MTFDAQTKVFEQHGTWLEDIGFSWPANSLKPFWDHSIESAKGRSSLARDLVADHIDSRLVDGPS